MNDLAWLWDHLGLMCLW